MLFYLSPTRTKQKRNTIRQELRDIVRRQHRKLHDEDPIEAAIDNMEPSRILDSNLQLEEVQS